MSLPEILFISTFPPRECGIATYTHDLMHAINDKYQQSFILRICALENAESIGTYKNQPYFILKADEESSYLELSNLLLKDQNIQLVVIQHEFGLFASQHKAFESLLKSMHQPIVLVMHTVLPNPNPSLQAQLHYFAKHVSALVVMTQQSSQILQSDYQIDASIIHVIPHGTHLLQHSNKAELKSKFNLEERVILSTFGFIGTNKSIETTLEALPDIISKFPTVLFLIIGKTHPNTIVSEGEKYRSFLEDLVHQKGLSKHVKWINSFLPTPELLDYLSLTDIYLFTSNDPNQAVSGTFSYAISSGCPVISTKIPHAMEVLKPGMGILIDFNSPHQLAQAVNELIQDAKKREQMRVNSLQNMAFSAWENAAIMHANLFKQIIGRNLTLTYRWPSINLKHIYRLSTSFGIIQFAHINEPDHASGYTIDDNARALITVCEQYAISKSKIDLQLMGIYLDFILFCQQEDGLFLNYVSIDKDFTEQNEYVNLDDSIGRTIWALGLVISHQSILPSLLVESAKMIFEKAIESTYDIHSTRAMAFIIKGIYYAKNEQNDHLLELFANRLAGMYHHEASEKWAWFESYLTYANSLLPEAMLMAWQLSGNVLYKNIAIESFEFLLTHLFESDGIHVISNAHWSEEGENSYQVNSNSLRILGGEQAIDVCYTILTLHTFYQVFKEAQYLEKMHLAFDWFLGKNHLNQIIYNPITGGCYDGLELSNVNLNQGAESTISYTLARQTMEKIQNIAYSLSEEKKERVAI